MNMSQPKHHKKDRNLDMQIYAGVYPIFIKNLYSLLKFLYTRGGEIFISINLEFNQTNIILYRYLKESQLIYSKQYE